MLSAYDRRLALRAAAIAGIAALGTLVVIVATDEGPPWSRRLGLWAALAPLAGALGALGAIRLAEARGELRALGALGADPVQAARGAVIGGALLSAVGPLFAVSGLADLGGLFPRPAAAHAWVAEGGAMVELSQGLRVGPGGLLARIAPRLAGPASLPPGAAAFTVAALALAALACPLWAAALSRWGAARTGGGALRLAAGTIALLLAVGVFQAVAAGRLPAASLVAAPLVLLLDGAGACRRAARE